MKWIYDESSKTYLCGTSSWGCGVFEENGKWYINIVLGHSVELLTPEPDLETAKKVAEEYFLDKMNTNYPDQPIERS